MKNPLLVQQSCRRKGFFRGATVRATVKNPPVSARVQSLFRELGSPGSRTDFRRGSRFLEGAWISRVSNRLSARVQSFFKALGSPGSRTDFRRGSRFLEGAWISWGSNRLSARVQSFLRELGYPGSRTEFLKSLPEPCARLRSPSLAREPGPGPQNMFPETRVEGFDFSTGLFLTKSQTVG